MEEIVTSKIIEFPVYPSSYFEDEEEIIPSDMNLLQSQVQDIAVSMDNKFQELDGLIEQIKSGNILYTTYVSNGEIPNVYLIEENINLRKGDLREVLAIKQEDSGITICSDVLLNLKGPIGEKGNKGDAGAKGATGSTGPAGTITSVTASVDSNVGTPYVDITTGGSSSARTIHLAFHNIKGATGSSGGSKTMYRHNINMLEDSNASYYIIFTIISTQSTNYNFTNKTLGVWLNEHGYSLGSTIYQPGTGNSANQPKLAAFLQNPYLPAFGGNSYYRVLGISSYHYYDYNNDVDRGFYPIFLVEVRTNGALTVIYTTNEADEIEPSSKLIDKLYTENEAIAPITEIN